MRKNGSKHLASHDDLHTTLETSAHQPRPILSWRSVVFQRSAWVRRSAPVVEETPSRQEAPDNDAVPCTSGTVTLVG